jgi:lincosamide nucleotidyltransferase A/C/D/E
MTGAMSVEQAKAVYDLLDQNSVRCWVMGGWGVDALLGCVTREHKDLDLLVLIEDLPRYVDLVRRHGFERKLVWSESQPIEIDAAPFDSAFVDAHPDGREIDVHVIDVDPRGVVTQFHADPWPLPRDASPGRERSTERRCAASPEPPRSPCTPAMTCPRGTAKTYVFFRRSPEASAPLAATLGVVGAGA